MRTVLAQEGWCEVSGTQQSTLLLFQHGPKGTCGSVNSSEGAVSSRGWWNPFLANPEDRQGRTGICTLQAHGLLPFLSVLDNQLLKLRLFPTSWAKFYFQFLAGCFGAFLSHCCAWQGWLDSAAQSRAMCTQSTQERAQDSKHSSFYFYVQNVVPTARRGFGMLVGSFWYRWLR